MSSRLIHILAASFSFALLSPAQAVEILHWERLPLRIPLVVNQERVVFMDGPIRVGVPASVRDRLRVQSTGGALYLLANAIIEPTRLQLQDTDNGTVILVDITAEPALPGQVALEPVQIVGPVGITPNDNNNDQCLESNRTASRASPVTVVLSRFAAQNLYAPLRTVDAVPGIAQTNLPRNLPLDTLLPTLSVDAQALVAWRLDNVWVTAVRLRNTSSYSLDLDPRAVQGKIVAATFQHPDLGPAGTPEDTTVVYLITRGHDLANALLPTINPVDAARNRPIPTAREPHPGGADAQ